MNQGTNEIYEVNNLNKKMYYYPYRAFGGQNKIVYSTRFVRRAIFFKYWPGNIFLILPGLYVTNHLTENRAMPRPP